MSIDKDVGKRAGGEGDGPTTKRRLSPREAMRKRHPERFSDTLLIDEPSLDRSLLEFHLDTLTSRGQEKDFEIFSHHLAQKEICPNLLPQTGPTGGGDSKVDSETYPVADDLAFAWYIGIGRRAAAERWAFAFSAKKDWRSKVRSDLEKIQTTDRGYSKAFFITNQSVPDRDRAKIEDELAQKHRFDVRILDRTWILDRVFENRHEALAVEDLGLQKSIRTIFRKGPRDLQRENELEEIESGIKAAAEGGRLDHAFVNDCLEAAELARDLELPRIEVDGRFARAKRAAEDRGSRHQKLISAYSRAWTSYWWYEDYPDFARRYHEVERWATGSRNAYELELLRNVWILLYSLFHGGEIEEDAITMDKRTTFLITELERLKLEEDRPSTALQARSLLLSVKLVMTVRASGDVEPILRGLRDLIGESRQLIGFPLEPLAEALTEVGEFLGQSPGYQDLHDAIVEVVAERSGELRAARMILDRGAQQLEAHRPADAIRSLGRGLSRLYKHESRHDLVTALYLCGEAYDKLGLLWAARGSLLNAASLAADDFWSYERITLHQVACYSQLRWLELRLGRLPHALAWHEVARFARFMFMEKGYHSTGHADSESHFDAILGMLLLKTDIWHLKRLAKLPDMLTILGLAYSSIALRFALGDEDSVVDELDGFDDHDALAEFFLAWRDQPAGDRLPDAPQLYDGLSVTLKSNILGCRIKSECENNPACVGLAESILGALESLLATGIEDRFVAREPSLAISVRQSEFTENPFGWSIGDAGGQPRLEVHCGDLDWTNTSPDAVADIKRKLTDMIAHVMATVFVFGDIERSMTKLFRDDRALERAIHFAVASHAVFNVLGNAPRTTLSAWSVTDAREYELTRSEPWDASSPHRIEIENATPAAAGRELLQEGRLAHSQIRSISLIRTNLWDKAKWLGVVFIESEDGSAPPLLAPLFQGAEAAGQIFRLWFEDLGDTDEEERLRISILRGINKSRPLDYRVIFAANPESAFIAPRSGIAVSAIRIHTMTPDSHANLDRFIANYRTHGRYGLAYCICEGDPSRIQLVDRAVIMKRQIFIRDAREIGPNDIDWPGIFPEDNPFPPSTKSVDVK